VGGGEEGIKQKNNKKKHNKKTKKKWGGARLFSFDDFLFVFSSTGKRVTHVMRAAMPYDWILCRWFLFCVFCVVYFESQFVPGAVKFFLKNSAEVGKGKS